MPTGTAQELMYVANILGIHPASTVLGELHVAMKQMAWTKLARL